MFAYVAHKSLGWIEASSDSFSARMARIWRLGITLEMGGVRGSRVGSNHR